MISDIAMIMKCCIETNTSTSRHGEISIECTHDMPMTFDIWHDMAWYVKFAITWFGIVKRVKECITRQGRKKLHCEFRHQKEKKNTFCCETSCLGKRLGPRSRRMILSHLNNSGEVEKLAPFFKGERLGIESRMRGTALCTTIGYSAHPPPPSPLARFPADI